MLIRGNALKMYLCNFATNAPQNTVEGGEDEVTAFRYKHVFGNKPIPRSKKTPRSKPFRNWQR
jgi:hypothetical protein